MPGEEPEVDTVPPKKAKGKATRASISIEGETTRTSVDDVMEVASGVRRGGGGAAAKTSQPQRFEKAIRDPNNRIVAKRQSPMTTLTGDPLGDEFHDLLPHDRMTLDEIKRDLAEARGGKKWHIKVEDPDGKIVAADTINVPGEPKLEPGFDEPGGGDMELPGGEAETLEDKLANDPEVIREQKELRLLDIRKQREEKEAELAEARARRADAERATKGESHYGNGNGHKTDDERTAALIEKANAPLKEALAASNRALEEERQRGRDRDTKAERKAEQEAMMAPLKAMQEQQGKTLEALLTKMNTPVLPTGPSSDALMAKLDTMKSELKSDFTQQIMGAINGVKDGLQSKIETVANAVAMLSQNRNDPATNALIALATKSGPGGAAPADPFSGLERALTTLKNLQTMTGPTSSAPQDFPSYLVERVTSLAPDVMEFMREQSANAQVVTKDVMEAKMKELGTKMWQGLDQTIKQEIRNIRVAPQAAQVTPAPGQATQGPPPPPVRPTPAPAGVGPTPLPVAHSPTATPPPIAAAPGVAPTAVPAVESATVPPTAAYPFGMTKEDFIQTQKRVNHVLKILHGEMRLGVQAFKWPEQAFAHLPKPIIDALLPATTDVEIKNVIEPFGDPAIMQAIWSFLSDTHPQHEWYRKWITDGINWLKDAANDQGGEEDGEPVVEEGGPAQ